MAEISVFQELVSQEAELQNLIIDLKQETLSLKEFEESKHHIRLKVEDLRKKIKVIQSKDKH